MTRSLSYVLFVDDDSDDQDLIRDFCEEVQLRNRAEFVESGEALFAYLSRLGSKADYPSLIVLDINMPGMNGEEVLLLLKRDPRIRHIPVIFFSTGSRSQSKYIELGAEAFYTKPFDYSQIRNNLHTFFLRLEPTSLS